MEIKKIQKALLDWFEINGREHLPWRQTNDPYKIYISEIMLQQTQAERVAKEYYPRFIKYFPTLKSLANAPLEEVLRLWSGLGYYARARNLHKCAQIYQDELPKRYEELLKLPGIGSYTASAICSFAYNQPIVVIDTNIKRFLQRFFATTDQKLLKAYANDLLNKYEPKDHNLALMDIGATICTPNPSCLHCPVAQYCQGRKEPLKYWNKQKRNRIKKALHFGLYLDQNHIALSQSSKNLYKDLWLLPNIDQPTSKPFCSYNHAYTKYDLRVYIHILSDRPKDATLVPLEKISLYPMASITTKALHLAQEKGLIPKDAIIAAKRSEDGVFVD